MTTGFPESTQELKQRYFNLGEELLLGNGKSESIRAERISILHQIKQRSMERLSNSSYRIALEPVIANKLEVRGIIFARK